jgi:hypothetical protein
MIFSIVFSFICDKAVSQNSVECVNFYLDERFEGIVFGRGATDLPRTEALNNLITDNV